MFWLRNKKKIQLSTLIWGPAESSSTPIFIHTLCMQSMKVLAVCRLISTLLLADEITNISYTGIYEYAEDRMVASSRLTGDGVTVLCTWARHFSSASKYWFNPRRPVPT